MLWYGSVASIPSGWVLCDGNNSTPDLRNRFVIGAGTGGNYSPDDTGGSADATLVSHSHTINNHTHSFSGSDSHSHTINNHTHTINNHTHSFTTGGGGAHSHNLLYDHGSFGGSSGAVTPRSGNTPVTPGISGRVSTHSNHTHSGTTGNPSDRGTGNPSDRGTNSQTVSISGNTGNPSDTGTNSQGSSATNKNLPPYYALCYIMKT